MAKDPAFLFYPGDWLGGTMGMTFEQKGAYFELLVFQFNNGAFTEAQAKQVLSICSASVWQVVSTKFAKDGIFYKNARLEQEIIKRKAFSESRRINALHTKSNKKQPKKRVEAYAKHMENENENKDINIIESEFQKKLRQFYDFRKQLKKPIIEASKESFKKKLLLLSNGSESTAIAILEQSIANGWQGIFELKTKNNGNNASERSQRTSEIDSLSKSLSQIFRNGSDNDPVTDSFS